MMYTFIGDLVIFACGCAVGHFGPEAVLAFFKKEVNKVKSKNKK
jgi:hypothetical protein